MRLNCLIGDCNRTYKNREQYDEWICQKHWVAIPRRVRKAYRIAKALHKKNRITDARLNNAWLRCVDHAYRNSAFV